jgi:hypothetical protein
VTGGRLRVPAHVGLVIAAAVACWSCSSGGTGGGAGGTGGNAGTSGGACPGANVIFRLGVGDPTDWFIRDSGQGCAPASWLSISTAAGQPVSIGYPETPCCQLRTCATCQFDVLCQTGWMQMALPVTRTWDGTTFPAGTCGTSALACVSDKTCAPAGSYKAHLCAFHRAGDVEQTECVDVPFDLPRDTPVVGNLP